MQTISPTPRLAGKRAFVTGGASGIGAVSRSFARADPGRGVLVNNAGIQHVAPVEESPPEQFALILRLVLEAPFLLSRVCLPRMPQ